MESPSDSVNVLNADVPLDNDGGEKAVGALLLNDSGPMEKRPQMVKDKRIIPFPFGHEPEAHRRKKRDAQSRKRVMLLTKFAAGTTIIAIIFTGTSYYMNRSIQKVGKSNMSRDYLRAFTAYIVLSFFFMGISFALLFNACYICLKARGNTIFGYICANGTDQSEIEMD